MSEKRLSFSDRMRLRNEAIVDYSKHYINRREFMFKMTAAGVGVAMATKIGDAVAAPAPIPRLGARVVRVRESLHGGREVEAAQHEVDLLHGREREDAVGVPRLRLCFRRGREAEERPPHEARPRLAPATCFAPEPRREEGRRPRARVGQEITIEEPALLELGARYQAATVLVEAGPTLLQSFAAEGLIDEVVVYVPGLDTRGARPRLVGAVAARLNDERRWEFLRGKRVGADAELVYRRIPA